MTIPDDLAVRIRSWAVASGLAVEKAAHALAILLVPGIGLMTQGAFPVLTLTDKPAGVSGEKDRLLRLAMKGALDAAGQSRLLALMEERDVIHNAYVNTGSLTLSEEQKDGIRKLGLNPERISLMSDDTDYEGWKKLKAETGRGAA